METRSFIICSTFRASDRSRKKKSNFAEFLGTNSRKKQRISREFRRSFQGKLHQKAISKKQPILCSFSRQILLAIDRFCADQTSVFFKVFLTGVIICSFNNNTLQKWTNGKAFNIIASAQFFATWCTPGSYLHVLVTKFQDKFASLRQVNSPNSRNKFQICFTDIYLIRFLPNFAGFRGFTWISRLRNIAKYQKPCTLPLL